jgi:hypothetical protein
VHALILKPVEMITDPYIAKLQLEQEIYKTFVAGHPLDSVYRFAK